MIPARVELYILALLVITVTTFNLNVASTTIVSMVKEFYMRVPETDELNACHKRVNASTNNGGSLEWSGDVQFLFLTSPYLGYVVVQTLGGYATQRFGTKKVIGCSLLTISACNLVLPIGCKVHYSFAIVLQFVQGFAQGGIWPGLFGIIPYWIPLRERSRFGSCFQGSAIGAMSAQFIARLATPSIGWEYIFVVAAFVGLIMSLGWFLLACNEPELHPRITLDELDYIKKHQQVLPPYRDKIPWGSMVGSLPLWAILFSAFGRAWFGNTIGISGPLYLKAEIGLDDGSIGDFSGAIHFASFLTGLIFAYIADRLLIEDVVGVLANRRLLLGIGQIPSAVLMISMGYVYCNVPILLCFWALVHVDLSACAPSAMVNVVDVAPNFAGPAISLILMIAVTPNVFVLLVTNSLLQNMNALDAWKYTLSIAGGISLVSCVLNIVFVSTKVQKWNYAEINKDDYSLNEKTKLINR